MLEKLHMQVLRRALGKIVDMKTVSGFWKVVCKF